MNKASCLFILIPILLVWFSEGLLGQNVSRSGHDYALFIYTSEFDEKWVDLPTVPKEIDLIAEELRSNYGFKTEVLANPKKFEVVKKLTEYANKNKFGPGDQLLLFISTHGDTIDARSGGLVFKDGKFLSEDPTLQTFLSYQELKGLIQNIGCNHLLLTLDACYSGIFADEFKSGPDLPVWQHELTCEERVVESLRGHANLYFTSVGKDERSPSESAFALRFLNRLQESDDDGIISYYELYAKLLGYVRPKPHSGEFAQTHENGSDFVFIRKNVCTEDAKKGTASIFVPPILKAANLKDPPTLNAVFQELKNADLLSVCPRVEGGFAAFGYTNKSLKNLEQAPEIAGGGGEDICLVLVDRFNKEEKVLTLGRKGNERALSGIQTYDGGYALVGYSDSPGLDRKGGRDCYICKLNAKGEYEWHVRLGDKSDDQFNKVVQMDDGSIVAVGQKGNKPIIAVFTAQGKMTATYNDLPVRGGYGEIKSVAKTPYDDLLIVGNCGNNKSQEPFMMRFSLEEGERVGNGLYIDKSSNAYQVMDVIWNSLGQIILLCNEKNVRNQSGFTLFYYSDKNNDIVSASKPISYGGEASDVASSLFGDIFGNTYITGAGKSYKNKGGLFDRLFLLEVDKNGLPTGVTGWQGSFKGSHGSGLAILPGRRLIVSGQDSETAWLQHFGLGLSKNEKPRLFFDSPSIRYFDGSNLNGYLDANEKSWYMLRIENKGEYVTGAVVQVDPVSQKSGVQCPRNLYLGDIPAASGLFVALPISGNSDLVPGTKTDLKLTLVSSLKPIGESITITVQQ